MTMRRLLLPCLLFALLSAALLTAQAPDSPRPAPAPVRPFRIPGYSETSLPNGMNIVFVDDARFQLVTARLVFAGGSKRDPRDMPGISAAFASLLLRGTAARSAKQFSEDLDGIGSTMSVAARPDSIVIEGSALKESTGSMLILISDLLRSVQFPDREVDDYRRARAQFLRNQAVQPGAIAAKVLGLTIFGPTQYGVSDPPPEVMDLIDRQAISDFRGTVFIPGNTTLIMIGALPAHADLMKALTYVFGEWNEKKPAPYLPPKAPEPAGRFLLVDRPGAPQVEIRIGRTGPSFANPDALPLQIASYIVGGHAQSRIATALHDTLKPGDEVHTDVSALVDAGTFSAVARVRNEVAGEVLQKTLGELNRITNEPVDPVELDTAKSIAAGAFVERMQTQQNLADLLTMVKLAGVTKDYIEGYPGRIAAIDAAKIQDVARKFIAPDKAVVVVVGDAGKIRDQLAKIGTFETVTATGQPVAPKQ
jgi:zinc protease